MQPGTAGSVPEPLTFVDGELIFAATTPTDGREPWITDGTAGGTRQIADLIPGPGGSRPTEGVTLDLSSRSDLVILSAEAPAPVGVEPHVVFRGALSLLDDLEAGAPLSSDPEFLCSLTFGKALFRTTRDDGSIDFYVTDGEPQSLQPVFTLSAGISAPRLFETFGLPDGSFLFSARVVAPGPGNWVYLDQIYRISADGSPRGVSNLRLVQTPIGQPGPTDPGAENFVLSGNRVLFRFDDQVYEFDLASPSGGLFHRPRHRHRHRHRGTHPDR